MAGIAGFTPKRFSDEVKDFARPNLFLIEIAPPEGLGGEWDAISQSIYARATTLPPRTLELVEIPFQGLRLRLPGNPTYDDWTVTLMADAAHALRNALLEWQDRCYNPAELEYGSPSQYLSDNVKVHQLHRDGTFITSIRLVQAWPATVGEIALSQEETGPEEFDVTFSYAYWTAQDDTGFAAAASVSI